MTPKNILFVDDELNVLSGIKRMLRPYRDEWNMNFAESGVAALSLLEREHYDIVVSDMRMPNMDGAQLLSEIKRRYPHIIRIILSGFSESEMIMRSVNAAHQFLSKPCDPEQLKNTILRALRLKDVLENETLVAQVAQLNSLPSLPALYLELQSELQSPNSSIKSIARIIAQDPSMTGKILQLVNSSFFGIGRNVTSTEQAVNLLGIDNVKNLALSIEVFSQFDLPADPHFSLEKLWRHSIEVATFAKKIAEFELPDKRLADEAFSAGLLHDLGKLILEVNHPGAYAKIDAIRQQQQISLLEAELQLFGVTHDIVGGFLFGTWGLPTVIVETIAFHHNPSQSAIREFLPLSAVHVANVFTYLELPADLEQTNGNTPAIEVFANTGMLDLAYIETLKLQDRLPEWLRLWKQLRSA